MEELLRELLNEMERLDGRYREFDDTVVREAMWSSIEDGFINPKTGFRLRWFYGLLSPVGNLRIRRAVGRYIRRAQDRALRLGLTTQEERADAFENIEVRGAGGSTYDDWFGGGSPSSLGLDPFALLPDANRSLNELFGAERIQPLVMSGRYQEVLSLLDNALANASDSHQIAEIHWLRSRIYDKMRNATGAIGALRNAANSDASNAKYASELGRALFFEGAYSEAAGYHRLALRFGDDTQRGHAYLGDALAEMGMLDEAINAYEASIRAGSGKPYDWLTQYVSAKMQETVGRRQTS